MVILLVPLLLKSRTHRGLAGEGNLFSNLR